MPPTYACTPMKQYESEKSTSDGRQQAAESLFDLVDVLED